MASIEFKGYVEEKSNINKENTFVVENVIVDSEYIKYLNHLISDKYIELYDEEINSKKQHGENEKVILENIWALYYIIKDVFYHSFSKYSIFETEDNRVLIETENYSFSSELKQIMKAFGNIGMSSVPINDKGRLTNDWKQILEDFFKDVAEKNRPDLIENLVSIVEQLKRLYDKIDIAHDLFFYKEEFFTNLADVCSKEVLEKYKNEYELLLSQKPCNLDKIYQLYEKIQSLIVDDWNNKITNPADYKPGDTFKFICYSIGTLDNCSNDRDNFERFVSASLFTERNQNAYARKYGFILDPNDIVSSSSKDQYINNASYNISSLYASRTRVLPELESIEKIIKALDLNKIIMDKFKPIGIFCLTNGTKELNSDYVEAQRLQKSFPKLPIVDIDTTLYKELDVSLDEKKNVIDSIIKHLNISSFDYSQYIDDFWISFTELKLSGNYSLNDITDLFNKFIYDKYIEDIATEELQHYSRMFEQALREDELFDKRREAQNLQEWKNKKSSYELYSNYKKSIIKRLKHENSRKTYETLIKLNELLSKMEKNDRVRYINDKPKER